MNSIYTYTKNLFLLFFILTPTLLFSQNNIDDQLSFIEKNILDNNFEQAEKDLQKLLILNKDNTLNTVKIYVYYVDLYYYQNDFKKALSYANLSKELSDRTEEKLDDAYTFYSFAKIYEINQLYDKTIAYSNDALKILNHYNSESLLSSKIYSTMSNIHMRLGIYNDEFKEYVDKAVYFANKSKNQLQIINANSLETVMYIIKYNNSNNKTDLDNVFKSAIKTVDLIEKSNPSFVTTRSKVITYNNLASIINKYPYKKLSDNERYDLAESYLKKALDLSINVKNSTTLATCYATRGEIAVNKRNNELAEKYFLKAYNIANDNYTNQVNMMIQIAKMLASVYEKTKQTDKALGFNRVALEHTKKKYEISLDNKRKFLEAYYSFEHKNQEIKQLKEKNDIYSKQIYLYISIAILSIFGLIFLVYLIRYKQKLNIQQTELLVSEKNETILTLQLEQEEKARLKAESDLAKLKQEQLHKQALATTIQLNQKNIFLRELKEKVKNENIKTLDRILKEDKISDHDFNNINTIIKDVHPNFFNKLNEISKNKLTSQDLKYAAYIYLNMDNIKIAEILRVEVKTVRTTKYRLKQKIGLEKEIDLTEFIQNINL
jgi:tetratricopeptide (TPR) repeat protein